VIQVGSCNFAVALEWRGLAEGPGTQHSKRTARHPKCIQNASTVRHPTHCAASYALCGILRTVWHPTNCVAFCALCGILRTVRHPEHCVASCALCGILPTVRHPTHCVASCALCGILRTVWHPAHCAVSNAQWRSQLKRVRDISTSTRKCYLSTKRGCLTPRWSCNRCTAAGKALHLQQGRLQSSCRN